MTGNEKKALDALVNVARNATFAMADSEDAGEGIYVTPASEAEDLCQALLELSELPDTGECSHGYSRAKVHLERYIADLERDAKRYRKVRALYWNDSPMCVVANPKANLFIGAHCPSGEQLDTLVDNLGDPDAEQN